MHGMFRKVAFLEISRRSLLILFSLNATKNELLTKFLKYDLKLTENFQEVISAEVPYQNFTVLQAATLRVFKAPKAASMVEFLSSEAGASGFFTE